MDGPEPKPVTRTTVVDSGAEPSARIVQPIPPKFCGADRVTTRDASTVPVTVSPGDSTSVPLTESRYGSGIDAPRSIVRVCEKATSTSANPALRLPRTDWL